MYLKRVHEKKLNKSKISLKFTKGSSYEVFEFVVKKFVLCCSAVSVNPSLHEQLILAYTKYLV